MKKIAGFATGLSFLAVFSFALFGAPALASAGESIQHYNVIFDVSADGSFTVDEKIAYDFGTYEKHGIYRDIPVIYRSDSGLNAHVYISDIRVTDEAGVPYSFTVGRNGNDERIQIGDPDRLVSGAHTYHISYKVKDGLSYFDSYDEIYWNAVGTGWEVPIGNVLTVVNLPREVSPQDLRISCYYGPEGSTASCEKSAPSEASNTVVFMYGSLNPHEGLSVAVGFPKGIVREPSAWERFVSRFLSFNWFIILLPVFVFLVSYRMWNKKGRDPKGSGVIIPQYDVADDLSPMEAAFLVNQGKFGNSLSAEIVFLAQRGYLRIVRTESKVLFISTHDYTLQGLKAPDDSLKPFQKELLDSLFTTFPSEVKISSLKNTFYTKSKNIESKARDYVLKQGYYPERATGRGRIVNGFNQGTAMSVIGFLSAMCMFYVIPFGLEYSAAFLVTALILIIFAKIMPVMTEKGVATREHLLGLKLYVSVAEKNRIDFHNAPEKNPETFEKFLPYAMVFGVEKAWAKEFEGIYTQPPSWYSDPHMTGFHAALFASSLSDFGATAHSSMTSVPGSASGSGGGGFSGGGGGGGGGGSW